MPRYVIERDIPGAGQLSAEELTGISRKSCAAVQGVGRSLQWVRSQVTADKVYCEYIAPDEQAIMEHAERGGFPITRVSPVLGTIDPTTAE